MSTTTYAPDLDLDWDDDVSLGPDVDVVLVDRALAGDRLALRRLNGDEWLEAMRIAGRRRWSVTMIADRMHTRTDRVRRLAAEAGVEIARVS